MSPQGPQSSGTNPSNNCPNHSLDASNLGVTREVPQELQQNSTTLVSSPFEGHTVAVHFVGDTIRLIEMFEADREPQSLVQLRVDGEDVLDVRIEPRWPKYPDLDRFKSIATDHINDGGPDSALVEVLRRDTGESLITIQAVFQTGLLEPEAFEISGVTGLPQLPEGLGEHGSGVVDYSGGSVVFPDYSDDIRSRMPTKGFYRWHGVSDRGVWTHFGGGNCIDRTVNVGFEMYFYGVSADGREAGAKLVVPHKGESWELTTGRTSLESMQLSGALYLFGHRGYHALSRDGKDLGFTPESGEAYSWQIQSGRDGVELIKPVSMERLVKLCESQFRGLEPAISYLHSLDREQRAVLVRSWVTNCPIVEAIPD